MFTKPRKVVALGVAIAVGVSGVAMGTAASNEPQVIGKVAPTKLAKKKFTPVNLTLGLRNSSDWVTGAQSNPASELIQISKNVNIDLTKAPRCNKTFLQGTDPSTAKAQCPNKSLIGTGKGAVAVPPGPTILPIEEIAVFNGPKKKQVQMVTKSNALGAGSPVILGDIVKAPQAGFKHALSVNPTPETGAALITHFQAKLKKSSKVVTAKCAPKKFKFHRTVTYKDATSETVQTAQRCQVK